VNRWKQTEPELLRLIGAASDGTASQRQIDALETRLRADPVAMRLYIDCCQLELDLQVEHYAAAATSRALVSIDQPIAGAPASKRPFPAWIAREIHWKSHPGRFVGLSLGLMIAFWFALFAIVGPRLQESKTEESPQAAAMRAPMVARLRQAIGCEWEEVKPFSTPSVGLFLQQGRTLRLKHGLAELVFNRGTMVVLEGPCEFTLLGDNAGRLESGKLMAHVPPGAVGFITHTPHATVTDLGTHFCVEVVEADTEVMCFEGAVRLAAGSPEQGDRRTSVLTAGNSAVVAASGEVLVKKDDPARRQSVVPLPRHSWASQAPLAHRYSFNGAPRDSIGGAHGELIDVTGRTDFGGGWLTLGNDGTQVGADVDHVRLPAGTVSSLGDSATFEAWVMHRAHRRWQRIFDFGETSVGKKKRPGEFQDALVLTLDGSDYRGLGRGVVAEYRRGADNEARQLHRSSGAATPLGQPIQVVLTWDGPNHTASLYVNGGKIAEDTQTHLELSSLKDEENFLGRSRWAKDAGFVGGFDELRIYRGALTDEEVAASYRAGPDAAILGPAGQWSNP